MNNKDIKLSSNKSFGLLFFLVFLIVSVYPVFKEGDLRIWSLILSLVFLFLGLLNSSILTPLNKLWFKLGITLGNIVSPIVMGLVFFLVVTPTSLLMKIFGKDILNLKKNKSKSYWIEKTGPKSKMKEQF
ncbi:SxtJ family membrane protein [Candidatus Pelagibacter sp.]|nr:SxtJ family membrane protein [Candidatus Pelagibacter sp.]